MYIIYIFFELNVKYRLFYNIIMTLYDRIKVQKANQ